MLALPTATAHRYIDQLASLPYLTNPEKAYKLPIYEQHLNSILIQILEADYHYVDQLSNFLFQDYGGDLGDYQKQLKNYLSTAPSKVFQQMISNIFAWKWSFREIAATINNLRFKQQPELAYSKITEYLSEIKTSKTYLNAKNHIHHHEYYSAHLLLLQKYWQLVDNFQAHNSFNLEGVFIYKFKWKILNAWLQLHDKVFISDNIDNHLALGEINV